MHETYRSVLLKYLKLFYKLQTNISHEHRHWKYKKNTLQPNRIYSRCSKPDLTFENQLIIINRVKKNHTIISIDAEKSIW